MHATNITGHNCNGRVMVARDETPFLSSVLVGRVKINYVYELYVIMLLSA